MKNNVQNNYLKKIFFAITFIIVCYGLFILYQQQQTQKTKELYQINDVAVYPAQKLVNMKNNHGKIVVINFWATSCTSCLSEIPHWNKIYQKYHHQGLELLNVALDFDDLGQINQVAPLLSGEVLFDKTKKWSNTIGGVAVTPLVVVLGKNDEIIDQWVGVQPDLMQRVDKYF